MPAISLSTELPEAVLQPISEESPAVAASKGSGTFETNENEQASTKALQRDRRAPASDEAEESTPDESPEASELASAAKEGPVSRGVTASETSGRDSEPEQEEEATAQGRPGTTS